VEPLITVVICTLNRSEYLRLLLESLVVQSLPKDKFKVIVVDNGSSDNTLELANSFRSRLPLQTVTEPDTGLSKARNLGARLSNTKWIAYIDDESVLPESYLQRAYTIAQSGQYDCFGGPFYARYLHSKPLWLPKDFGTMKLLRESEGLVEEGLALAGGNLVIRQKNLLDCGGFSENLGMRGEILSYGEDDYIQMMIRKNGGRIGFIPDLFLYHHVLPHKYVLHWHLKSAYQHGKLNGKIYQTSTKRALFLTLKSFLATPVKHLPIAVLNLMTHKDYYWQNLIIDSISPIIYRIGVLTAKCQKEVL
jgi:glucosyl-dolichyl phosphate glucuronosyltransferase